MERRGPDSTATGIHWNSISCWVWLYLVVGVSNTCSLDSVSTLVRLSKAISIRSALLFFEEASTVRAIVTSSHLLLGYRRHSLHGVGVVCSSSRIVTVHYGSIPTLSECLLKSVATVSMVTSAALWNWQRLRVDRLFDKTLFLLTSSVGMRSSLVESMVWWVLELIDSYLRWRESLYGSTLYFIGRSNSQASFSSDVRWTQGIFSMCGYLLCPLWCLSHKLVRLLILRQVLVKNV